MSYGDLPRKEKSLKIFSPMPRGNGAYVVHKILESEIPEYQVSGYHPLQELFPPSLWLTSRQNKGFDIVHTVADYGCFFKSKNSPLVITFHNYVLDSFMRKFSSLVQNIHYQTDLKYFIRRSVRAADVITAVSQATADLVQQELAINQPIRVINNGVDIERFKPARTCHSELVRVLFCGNLSTRKGAHWLPEIADRVKDNVRICYTRGLRSRKQVPDHPKLECIGSIPHHQMPECYNSMDILFMPTVREGLAMATLEAMACGLPVVATDISSMPELVDDELGGYLVPLGDVVAFADRINVLASDDSLRERMGQHNRRRVEEQFGMDRMVQSYRTLFEELAV